MTQKMTLPQIKKTLDAVLAAASQDRKVYKAMAERIEMRRKDGIDRLISEHVSDEDMRDFFDEAQFESDSK